jgi:hypothetical protein
MSTEEPTPQMIDYLTRGQAIELGRLVDEYQPDIVSFRDRPHPGQPTVVTFLRDGRDDVEWVIDINGDSWPADRSLRSAA